MAAHLLTGLRDVYRMIGLVYAGDLSAKEALKTIRGALDVTSFTEELSLGHWRQISAAVEKADLARIKSLLDSLIPHAEMQWDKLGRPATREEWLERVNRCSSTQPK